MEDYIHLDSFRGNRASRRSVLKQTKGAIIKWKTKERWTSMLLTVFPILDWFPKYYLNKNWFGKEDVNIRKKPSKWYHCLKDDVIAGLSTGFVAVPQAMAYSMIAGLPPVYGLYCALVSPLIYFLFGSSMQLIVGPTSILCLLLNASLEVDVLPSDAQKYIEEAMLLTFVTGICMILLSFLRFGFVAGFLSHPVISGFSAGAAIIIGSTQLSSLLGLSIKGSKGTLVKDTIIEIAKNIHNTNFWALVLGLGCLALILSFRLHPKLNYIPSALVVVILGILLSWSLKLDKKGVKIVGNIPEGLPPIDPVNFYSFNRIIDLVPRAMLLALVGFMESYSIAKTFALKNKTEVDANQELLALGLANAGGAFFSSFVTTGSFSRTAVSARAGGKTPMANLVSSLLVLFTLLVLTPLFHHLPSTVLAAIVLAALTNLVDYKEAIFLFRTSKWDFCVLIFALVATLLLGVEIGISVSLGASLLVVIYRVSRPPISMWTSSNSEAENREESQNPYLVPTSSSIQFVDLSEENEEISAAVSVSICNDESENEQLHDNGGDKSKFKGRIVVMRFEQPLIFLNVSYFRDTINQLANGIHPQDNFHFEKPKAIIIDLSHCNYIDSTAVHSLVDIVQNLEERGIAFVVYCATQSALETLENGKALSKIGKQNIVNNMDSALRVIIANQVNDAHSSTSPTQQQNQKQSEKTPLLPV